MLKHVTLDGVRLHLKTDENKFIRFTNAFVRIRDISALCESEGSNKKKVNIYIGHETPFKVDNETAKNIAKKLGFHIERYFDEREYEDD